MAEKISAVKGMNDILPPESARWEWLEDKVRGLMARYAYRNVRTPILEPTQLFVRGLGEVTDIVEKEMYSFEDRLNGEHLTLRPENTAGVVRAVAEHSLLYDGGKRLYYMGPMFRHERPQRGRYRQFHQIGAEALGFAGPDVDAELILLADALWKELGLDDVRLEINSLGQPEERRQHRTELIAYLEKHANLLDEDAKRRLHSNPLRILDTKNPAMQAMVEGAPRLIDFLGAPSLAHFDGLKAMLDANGIAYRINPRLVRGLDYYNLSVFEFVTDRLGAQGTICAGGRYDYLIGQIGGKPAPAVGLGDRRGAGAGAGQGAGRGCRGAGPRRLCRGARCLGLPARPEDPAGAARRRRVGADACRVGRRPGQHEVPVQEGRCQRRPLRAGVRRRRAGRRRGHAQGPARRQRRAAAPAAGRRGRLGRRPEELSRRLTTMLGCLRRLKGFHGFTPRPRRTGAA